MAFQAYNQNKGTLVPGQSITINKYSVQFRDQVRPYLYQPTGGFAHVYLVRTATPVYNTTHHVLKRIAVANESMLSEVKKEVDIMRLLRGHPNIVHLIDAAWHRMSDGLYEVFILMEYCPGGGIIDMMNRRLRERLTEAEILQIFIDVCEGVACMHNLRPALLHRDLKVENILQASPTSFKLCDFGSATPVAARPPASTQEIRILEADLNRHTTLQYRAPEMVDVFSRRPVDEKSDVWALGVLLYKLCYYTTPFEEHGPLAILNVQYRIPPYPVYSANMNALIASMLREHGTQRPNVFELLNNVHQLRGTKSQFQYSMPAPPPPLSPRNLRSNIVDNKSSSTPVATNGTKNAGVQARERVLEAIEPMRRGRPGTSSSSNSRASSPHKTTKPLSQRAGQEKSKDWGNADFKAEEDKAWKAATTKNSTAPAQTAAGDAWAVGPTKGNNTISPPAGFGDDFGQKLWDSFDPKSKASQDPVVKSLPKPPMGAPSAIRSGKDAFDGLGLMTPTPPKAPTLGEARKLRTGLAIMSTAGTPKLSSPSPSVPAGSSYLSSAQTRLSPAAPLLKPSSSGSSWSSQPPKSRTSPSPGMEGLPAESRFPSLEELDAQFSGAPPKEAVASTKASSPSSKIGSRLPIGQALGSSRDTNSLSSSTAQPAPSQQRPSLTRKHRSSVSIKPVRLEASEAVASPKVSLPSTPKAQTQRISPVRPVGEKVKASTPASGKHPEVSVLRESPSKRASYNDKTSWPVQEPDNLPRDRAPSSSSAGISPTISTFARNFPPLDPSSPTNDRFPNPGKSGRDSASSADEGPEDAGGYSHSQKAEGKKPKRKGRQSSVHDLVDLWSGSVPTDKELPTTRSTITPVSKFSGTGSTVSQRLPGMVTPSSQQTRSHSPEDLRSPPPNSRASRQTPVPKASTTSSPHSPDFARSRPQSMFIFPSTSPAESPATSPGLLVSPIDPKPRATRRTSISDMVQRYEAIGSSQKAPTSPVLPLKSPVALPIRSTATQGNSLTLPKAAPSSGDREQQNSRYSPTGLPRTSPISQSRSSPSHRQETTNEIDATPRARRASFKPDTAPVFPLRKSTTSSEASGEARSPSPDRPYLGVGRLIDQWQRKSEAANPGPPTRGLVTKRAGAVGIGRT